MTRLACTCLLCAVVLALLPPAPAGAADPVPALSDAAAYPQQAESCGVIIRALPGVAPAAIALAQQRLALLLEHLPQVQDNLRRAGAELRIVSDAAPASITGGVISYAQEANILKRSDDPFADHRDIVVHECSHMLHLCGFGAVQAQAIAARYQAVQAAGLWPGCYALTNDREFFAELTMWYFGTRGDYGKLPDPEAGRDWLARYDPESCRLLDELYRGVLPSERIAWVALAAQPAAAEGGLAALDSGERCYIRFANRSAARVVYSWLDYSGQRVKYGEIAPGDQAGMDTYVGHPWLLSAVDGTALAIYLPAAGHNLAVLDP